MKIKGLLALLTLVSIALIFSCTKINESTELGDELLPAVDNINTFDTTLEIQAAYYPFDDSVRQIINASTGINDIVALGHLNDPVFGSTNADIFFNLGSLAAYGTNPFLNKDSVKAIDSVVLSLAFQGSSYGDTLSQINVQVSELTANNGFNEDSTYRFDVNSFPSGPVLGSRIFSISELNDSIRIDRKNDTTKVANVLRIRLNNSLGERLRNFDTSATSPLGGFSSDSLFRSLFRGLAVKTTSASGSGALAYINLVDVAKTRLIVYYKGGKSTGVDSGASVAFGHIRVGQANSIRRTPAGEYLAKITNPSSQKLYIQSSPSGSYVSMFVPGLTGFPNKVIHRAELIAYRVPADNPAFENIFTTPNRLLLDHKGTNNSKDSAYIFDNDIQPGLDGSLDLASFGGALRSDQSYRFNLTRYVQGIVTRGERNDSLRLFAPFRASLYSKTLGQVISIQNLDFIAKGRVVIANNNFSDPSRRLRLRIIYSNL